MANQTKVNNLNNKMTIIYKWNLAEWQFFLCFIFEANCKLFKAKNNVLYFTFISLQSVFIYLLTNAEKKRRNVKVGFQNKLLTFLSLENDDKNCEITYK